jgi:hypothetical protein
VLIPTAFRRAAGSRGERAGTAVATWRFGDDTEAAELQVKPNGRLAEVRVNRWGNPADQGGTLPATGPLPSQAALTCFGSEVGDRAHVGCG